MIGSTKKGVLDPMSNLNAHFNDIKLDSNDCTSSQGTDIGALPTLSSDSCPFIEKYDMDEEAELLGEVRNFIF
jgi:hypothetical protein